MKRFFKIIGYTLLALAGLVVSVLVAVQFISDEQYRRWIAAAAQSATGRELSIDGGLDIRLGTKLSLAAHDVSLANAAWGSRDSMVTVDRLFAEVPLLPLFKGVLDVTLEADGPDILLETDPAGNGNWVFTPSGAEAGDKPPAPGTEAEDADGRLLPIKPYIRNLEVKNLVFAFNDHAGATRIDAGVESFRLFVDGERIPLSLTAQYQGAPIVLEGSLGTIDQWYGNEQTPVTLQGSLNDARLEVSGTAGPLLPQPRARVDIALAADSIDTFSAFAGVSIPDLRGLAVAFTAVAEGGRLSTEDIRVTLQDPRLAVEVAGKVEDLTGAGTVELQASVKSESAGDLLAGLGQQTGYALPSRIALSGSIQGDRSAISVRDLDMTIQDEGLDLNLAGGVENVLALEGGDVQLQFRLDSTGLIGTYLGQAIPSFGPISGSARLSSANSRIRLDSLDLDLSDPLVTAKIRGSASNISRDGDAVFAVNGIVLDGDVSSEHLDGIAEKFGVALPGELPASFSLHASAAGNVSEPESSFSVTDIEITIRDRGLDLNLSGGVENVLALEGGDVQLQVLLDSTDLIGTYVGQDIPSFGPVSVNARLSSAGSRMRLDSLVLDLSDPLVTARISGSASQIGRDGDAAFAVNGIVLNGDVSSEHLDGIAEKFGAVLPGELPASFRLHASAAGNLRELELQELNATVLDEGIDLQLTGKIENLIGLKGIEANLAGSVADTSDLTKFAGLEVPGLGALTLQGQVVSTEAGYRLNNLDVIVTGEQAELQVKAAIEDLLNLAKVDAVIDGNLASLAALSGLAQSDLPQTGPWKARITANSDKLMEAPLTLSATLDGEGIVASFGAQVADLTAPQTFQTDLKVDIDSLAGVLALVGREIPADTPLNLVASVSGKPGEYRLDSLSVQAGDSEISGDLAYRVPPAGGDGRTSLSGRLALDTFDFTPFLEQKKAEVQQTATGEMAAGAEEKPETGAPSTAAGGDAAEPAGESDGGDETAGGAVVRHKRIFSDEPLATGVLHDYDIDLKIDAADVTIRDGIVLDGTMSVGLADGYLRVEPFEIDQSAGGSGRGYIHLDAREADAVLDAVLNFDDFVSPRFGGLFNVDIDLDGSGNSVAALMGNLNGHLAATLRNVELQRSFMSQFGAGLLKHLNPLDSEKTTLECGVVRFDIENGMVDFKKKLAAQTSEVTWIGGGTIDLKTEEIDVGISPKARGALSSLTNIDFASLVHVGGTLAEPRIGLDVLDVAKKYAGYTAFVATGGLSFLAEKMVETVQANVDQCERILQDLEDK